MKSMQVFVASALVASAEAQTPNNYSVVSTAPLEIIGQPGNATINPSVLLPQSDVLDVPTIILDATNSNGSYAAFMIDPTTAAGAFLHWFQPNLVPDTNGNLIVDATATGASTAIGASYIYPQPQNDGYAHQYVILVYQQPADWIVPSNYSRVNPPADVYGRFPFDMADFQRAAGFSDPVGTNWFRVVNGTAEQTSALATATATASGLSTATVSMPTFTGEAVALGTGYEAAVIGLAAGIIALV